MKNDIIRKWTPKSSRSSYTHFDKADFKRKLVRKERGSHFINKGNNPPRRCTYYMYICTEYWGTNFVKQILLDIKRPTGPGTIMVGDFSTALIETQMVQITKINKETSKLKCNIDQMD
jgi:hypothetical protein